MAVNLLVLLVSFVLVTKCAACSTQKQKGVVCGTVGQMILGQSMTEFRAGLKQCVEACKADADCTAVNHWAYNHSCQLMQTGSGHHVGVAEKCFSTYVRPTCTISFETKPSNPMSYKFVLEALVAPLMFEFTVRAAADVIIGLATTRNDDDIFCHIGLGGWSNSKAVIRTGDMKDPEEAEVVIHEEVKVANQLSASEDRAFWIEYADGVVEVGYGGEGVPFMKWDTKAYYGRAYSKVFVAISTWKNVDGKWSFDQFCG